ncbi:MAG: hypothetical protein RIQ81_1393 [Pseudomonadota bacterium]
MTVRLFAVACYLGFVSAFLSLQAHAASLPAVDQIMAGYDRGGSPGAAVVVAKSGQILHMKGYGSADLEGVIPATELTSFRLASVSKQFIAMGIAMLREDGQLSLDDNIKAIFPEFPVYGRQIKVRHLIHHISGLVDYEDLIPSGQTAQLSDHDVLQLYVSKTRATRFKPGSQYSYSNGGYVLLGLVIERVSGQSLDIFLRERIFSRLGMSSEMYQGESSPIVDRAYGYSQAGGGWRRTDQSVTSATRGDGGIYASIRDLFLWDRALQPGTPDPLVGDAILAEIFKPGRLDSGEGCGYGFGWQIDTWRGLPRESHTGSTIGFRTAIQRYPSRKLMIAVLTNRNGGSPWSLAEQIADILAE